MAPVHADRSPSLAATAEGGPGGDVHGDARGDDRCRAQAAVARKLNKAPIAFIGCGVVALVVQVVEYYDVDVSFRIQRIYLLLAEPHQVRVAWFIVIDLVESAAYSFSINSL
jgi:hypothetical protein